jgi:hypothetical protein
MGRFPEKARALPPDCPDRFGVAHCLLFNGHQGALHGVKLSGLESTVEFKNTGATSTHPYMHVTWLSVMPLKKKQCMIFECLQTVAKKIMIL